MADKLVFLFLSVFLASSAEVARIVVRFTSNAGTFAVAVAGTLVVGAGLLLHRPLSAVSENTMNFVVGLMLATFGAFWAGEGFGIGWPGADLAIFGLLVIFVATAWLAVQVVRPRPVGAAVEAIYETPANEPA